jgi:hypothetical protein
MAKTRKAATAICQAQIRAGRKVLKAKTRKQALELLKKVPNMVHGNVSKGLKWWNYVKTLKNIVPDKKYIASVIEEQVPAMLEGCIKKHMAL